ncbi:MAG: Na/Pi cotransporter family protein, partial [Zetaproteobacteria bacterium]|nr:Na/Pi cotransporter family protein [Zetaproteobacteria bacterium]
MEIFATIFAGLGLFFVGIKAISENLKRMSGRKVRMWMAQTTRHSAMAALIGTLFGAITQSTSAVTFIVVSMVSSGMVQVQRALPIVAWSNVGTSVLVLLATIDIHLMILYLLGVVGLLHYFDYDRDERFRHLVGALFGIGILFLGLFLIKSGAAPLNDIAWVHAALTFSASSFTQAFLIGALLALVAQSSATVTVIAVTMTSAGLLTLDQTLMIAMGSGAGSGLSIY